MITFRSAAVLEPMLESLAEEASPGLRTVVVDNSSDVATEEVVRAASRNDSMQIEYVANKNLGYASGLNVGLERLRDIDDAVLVLNPDLTFVPGAIDALQGALEQDDCAGLIVPSYVKAGEPVAFWTKLPRPSTYWRWAARQPQPLGQQTAELEWGPGACMLARAAAVRRVGGMDGRIFLYMEDADWCRRFREEGWTIKFEPRAVVAHEWGHAGTVDMTARVLQTHLAKLYYFQKWHGRLGLLAVAGQMVVEALAKSVIDLARRRNLARRRGYYALLRAIPLAVSEGPIAAQDRLVHRG